MRNLIAGACVVLAAVGCARGDKMATDTTGAITPTADTVAAAAATAKAIEANPAAADSIISAAGYTRDSFQKLMYDIAADSAKAARYAAAKGG